MADARTAAAKTGITGTAALVGGAIAGPPGALGGAMVAAAGGSILDGSRVCKSIDEVKKMAVEKLPANQAIPLVLKLDELAGVVGCKPNRR